MAPKKSAKPDNKFTEEGRLLAVMACALVTAPIILFVEKKNAFARHYAKQGTAVLIIYLVLRAVLAPLWWINPWLPFLAAFLMAYVAVTAAQGKTTKIPLAYEFGEWLGKIFK